MKLTTLFIIVFYFLTSILACCNTEGSVTEFSIEEVGGMIYQFNENGDVVYNQFTDFNNIGIELQTDSLNVNTYYTNRGLNLGGALLACDDGRSYRYINFIDSVKVFTLLEFNSEYPAGADISEVVQILDYNNEEINMPLSAIIFEDGGGGLYPRDLQINSIANNDSLQFLITGRFSDKGPFEIITNLVTLED